MELSQQGQAYLEALHQQQLQLHLQEEDYLHLRLLVTQQDYLEAQELLEPLLLLQLRLQHLPLEGCLVLNLLQQEEDYSGLSQLEQVCSVAVLLQQQRPQLQQEVDFSVQSHQHLSLHQTPALDYLGHQQHLSQLEEVCLANSPRLKETNQTGTPKR